MKCLSLVFAPCLALLALVATGVASAAVFEPTKTTDSADGACDADCSLREAVLEANARSGDDVILLPAGVYTLTLPGDEAGALAGDLDVLGDLTMVGEGAATTVVDGDALDRLFDVPTGSRLELRDVALRNGTGAGGGGAVRNGGALTVLRCVLDGNRATADGGATGFGGAILSNGASAELSLRDSTLSGNSATGGGGGVAAGGTSTLANVTISGNSAGGSGGGLYTFASGHVTVDNVTIAGNAATASGGGAFAESSPFIAQAPVVSNSIFAGNGAGEDPDCSGPLNSAYDLIGNASDRCVGPSAANHDLVGSASAPIDPKLDVLREVGGPTPTRAPLAGSPALDAGNPAGNGATACQATDQRGGGRPAGAACDIGAFEVTTACVAGGPTLCLVQSRFRVAATWHVGEGPTNPAQSVTLTPESGYFWFFARDNVEVNLKVLDGCSFNHRFWVFASGLTDVGVDLTVTDTHTGTAKAYHNAAGHAFTPILDTGAFSTCP